MIKIGMMIGDRYEIIEKIGTGGMSDVYKAKCHKLNRFVAVKVLKQEFSENENFVSKFRIEAQAAAGLAHPNIVNVYDVGEENGIYYIVMELVEGITLKKYIEKKARLSYKEAVSIAIQVSMGIDAAHKNHIIHRDIKPQNIIISKEGKVKVTDFGIAKAATSNTITSNVMGSVHYTSPEQARGGYSDEKSDIYSLGITMFEMLTGRVPFNGETTVAIAIKHIQEELPSPQEYVSEIPTSVANIVVKCCQKSPDRRYQDTAEVIADLKQSLLTPDEDFVVINNPDIEAGTKMISDDEFSRIKSETEYQSDYDEYTDGLRLKSDTQSLYTDSDNEDEDEYDYDPKVEKITTILAVLAGIVIVIIIFILAFKIFGGFGKDKLDSPIVTETENTDEENTEKKMVSMPQVEGMDISKARATLEELGLVVSVEYVESNEVDAEIVITSKVAFGQEIEEGSTVSLVVSAGTNGVEVPQVTGLGYEEVKSKLEGLGFVVNKNTDYSDSLDVDVVLSQNPSAGTKAPKGSVITVTVSLGKEESKVRVPNLIGLTEVDGTIEAVEQGLTIGSVSYVYDATQPEGQICYQSYSVGSFVDAGTVIDIKVSQGPEPVKPVTYKCNLSIAAPNVGDDGGNAVGYVSGTPVNVKLTTDDGTVLLETTTSTFPQSANYTGLSAAGGTITMTYDVTTKSEAAGGEEGDSTIVEPTTQTYTITRKVSFTQE